MLALDRCHAGEDDECRPSVRKRLAGSRVWRDVVHHFAYFLGLSLCEKTIISKNDGPFTRSRVPISDYGVRDDIDARAGLPADSP
jgi:hypothetical protein